MAALTLNHVVGNDFSLDSVLKNCCMFG